MDSFIKNSRVPWRATQDCLGLTISKITIDLIYTFYLICLPVFFHRHVQCSEQCHKMRLVIRKVDFYFGYFSMLLP